MIRTRAGLIDLSASDVVLPPVGGGSPFRRWCRTDPVVKIKNNQNNWRHGWWELLVDAAIEGSSHVTSQLGWLLEYADEASNPTIVTTDGALGLGETVNFLSKNNLDITPSNKIKTRLRLAAGDQLGIADLDASFTDSEGVNWDHLGDSPYELRFFATGQNPPDYSDDVTGEGFSYPAQFRSGTIYQLVTMLHSTDGIRLNL